VLGQKADESDGLLRVPETKANARVEALVRNTLARSVAQLLAMDPQLRLSDDEEAVHKARVATRRLRSDLRTLRPVVDRRWSEPLRTELKWLGTALGEVRDTDVLLAELERKAAEIPDAQRAGVEPLLEELRRSRTRRRDALRDALDSTRYAQLLERLVAAAGEPSLRSDAARRRARAVARKLARKPRRRLRKAASGLDAQAADTDLHEVRKRAKEARYAHEALTPILGKRARRAAKRFEDVQEVLGTHQDAVVAAGWLHDAAQDTDRREEAFSAGELAGLFLNDRRTARDEWRDRWKRARNAGV
jgi:CHAD domain-containing protein